MDWADYYKNTKNYPPAPLLVKAVEYCRAKNKAIDIGGGGTLKDAKFLLSEGFETTVIDKDAALEVAAKNVTSEKLQYFVTDFVDFDFPENTYNMAAAIYSLPFAQPDTFNDVFVRVKKSLAKDGIFCGQFFGDRDGWRHNDKLAFVTKERAQSLLQDMDIILFDEKEFDGKTADGSAKHWHVFDIIARKK